VQRGRRPDRARIQRRPDLAGAARSGACGQPDTERVHHDYAQTALNLVKFTRLGDVVVLKKILRIAILMVCVFGILQAGVGATGTPATSLKPIDRAALQNTVDTTTKELVVPGAMVLLRTPQGEFIVGYGTTKLDDAIPSRISTHFRIASNTKTMTSAVIMLLAQEGKIRLDDPVSKYVPGVPNGDHITIAELLKMAQRAV
jgi:CubicO group peptidase (beta-lactamase class C family)